MYRLWPLLLLAVAVSCRQDPPLRLTGELQAWSPLTLTLEGPELSEEGIPNPFLDVRLTVRFEHADGAVLEVPGFFCADGMAAESGATSGTCWRLYFLPPKAGEWRFTVSFRSGSRIALSDDPLAGTPLPGDAYSATIRIAEPPEGSPPPRGKLRASGRRYLQFSGNGEWFLKGGADSPENFLAYLDFDGTDEELNGPVTREGEARSGPRHQYLPHVRDWRLGDPTWHDSLGRGIIGALNYLAEQGVNSVYMLTMNLYGDGKDVWPYTSHRERYRFDCSKLDQWEVVFRHMDRLGIAQHFVLTETENESLFEVEEGGVFADSRKLYYRELVARYAHHPAVIWNLGEENGWNDGNWDSSEPERRANTDQQRRDFAAYIRNLDPYRSPIVVHTHPNDHDKVYRPLLGQDTLDGVSLQVGDMRNVHETTLTWIRSSKESGRPWFAALDEIGPHHTGVLPDSVDPEHNDVRHYALWGNLMAGGAGSEWYFGYEYPHDDLGLEDFRSREAMWKQTRIALDFFRKHLPFWEMDPAPEIATTPGTWCLSKGTELMACYLPPLAPPRLLLPEGSYTVRWYDPRSGGELLLTAVDLLEGTGRSVDLGPPPDAPERDWVVLLNRQ